MQNNFKIIVQWLVSLAYTYHYKSKHWYIDTINSKKFDKMTNMAKIVKNKCKVDPFTSSKDVLYVLYIYTIMHPYIVISIQATIYTI